MLKLLKEQREITIAPAFTNFKHRIFKQLKIPLAPSLYYKTLGSIKVELPKEVKPRRKPGEPPIGPTGLVLDRPTTFKFQADLNKAQNEKCFSFSGAARYTYNYHVGAVKINLSQRNAERSYGIYEQDLTPALNWSAFSRIKAFNAYKKGESFDSPVNLGPVPDSGTDSEQTVTRGLLWHEDIYANVFESASTQAAQALDNWSKSQKGERKGKLVGFPKFKAKHKTTPAFHIRNQGAGKHPSKHPVRPVDYKSIMIPGIGPVRIHGTNKRMRRMIEAGRFYISEVTVKYEWGKWWICITGYAAPFHSGRTTKKGRHAQPAGADLGVKTQAVVADSDGEELYVWQGVKALRQAQKKLKVANKAFSRTKKGSIGREKARERLSKIHARIAYLRNDLLHKLTTVLATKLAILTVENLHVAGMLKNHCLALSIADAAFGRLRTFLTYKADWYGLLLILADRWFASSKTCSSCKHVEQDLQLSDRVFNCAACGLSIDRDLNAAINLANWGVGKLEQDMEKAKALLEEGDTDTKPNTKATAAVPNQVSRLKDTTKDKISLQFVGASPT